MIRKTYFDETSNYSSIFLTHEELLLLFKNGEAHKTYIRKLKNDYVDIDYNNPFGETVQKIFIEELNFFSNNCLSELGFIEMNERDRKIPEVPSQYKYEIYYNIDTDEGLNSDIEEGYDFLENTLIVKKLQEGYYEQKLQKK